MRRTTIPVLLLFFVSTLFGQQRDLKRLPDIPGYKTLLCDLHMHTVFSDGQVWPTVRVDEAWREGIDVIAITDHLEYLPHKKDIVADHDRSWKIARDYATSKDVIVIPGTEITKSMPPGHLNAIFIKDADAIYNDNYLLAIEEAVSQGAFIMWNHPGWKAQQPDTMIWWDEHSILLEKEWLHGLEVANHHESYPEAINWAREKGLTFIASSDVHAPVNMSFDLDNSHRPLTIVFATERSEGAVRDALFSGRTLAWYRDMIMGKEEFLKACFLSAVSLKNLQSEVRYAFINPTEILIKIELGQMPYLDWNKEIMLEPGKELVFNIPEDSKPDNIRVKVMNFYSGSEQVLELPLSEVLMNTE